MEMELPLPPEGNIVTGLDLNHHPRTHKARIHHLMLYFSTPTHCIGQQYTHTIWVEVMLLSCILTFPPSWHGIDSGAMHSHRAGIKSLAIDPGPTSHLTMAFYRDQVLSRAGSSGWLGLASGRPSDRTRSRSSDRPDSSP